MLMLFVEDKRVDWSELLIAPEQWLRSSISMRWSCDDRVCLFTILKTSSPGMRDGFRVLKNSTAVAKWWMGRMWFDPFFSWKKLPRLFQHLLCLGVIHQKLFMSCGVNPCIISLRFPQKNIFLSIRHDYDVLCLVMLLFIIISTSVGEMIYGARIILMMCSLGFLNVTFH